MPGYPESGRVLAGLSIGDLVEASIGATYFLAPASAAQIPLSLRFLSQRCGVGPNQCLETGTEPVLGGERLRRLPNVLFLIARRHTSGKSVFPCRRVIPM